MSKERIKVLLTSVGRRGYIIDYFKKIENVEVHASNSQYTYSMTKADSHFITPLVYENDYIEVLIEYCYKNKIHAIMSLFDIDLLVLGKNAYRFEGIGTKVLHAPAESLRICNDKWATALFANNNAINTPKTYLSITRVKNEILNNKLDFPLIIKPRWGMGSIGLYKVDNEQELDVLYKKCVKDVFTSYLKYESNETKDEPLVIQEFLKGKEYGLDVINDLEGNYVALVAKQKVQMRSGETDIGLTVDNKMFEGFAKRVSSLIKHVGVLSVDVFVCNDKEIYLIEMNCRISGHYPVAHCAGVNYPLQLIKWLRNEQTELSLLDYNRGIYVVKELQPIAIDNNAFQCGY